MGKYILLLTFSVGLGLAYYAQQSQQTSMAASEDQADRQETVLARQIARSAFEQGIGRVRQDAQDSDEWPPETLPADVPESGDPPEYEGGEYEISYQTHDGNVRVEAWGRRGHGEGAVEYRISGIAELKTDGLFDGITFDGPVTSANLDGNPRVIGNDGGSQGDRHAISVTKSGDKQKLKDGGFCDKPENISGVGGECDIVEESGTDLSQMNEKLEEVEDDSYEEEDICEAKGNTTIGSSSNPAFVSIEDECEISGNVSGTGILYVEEDDEEDLTMKGNVSWDGLIFFGGEDDDDEEKTSFQATKGNPRIEGAVAFSGGGGIDMRGNAEVKYNSDKLKNVLDAYDIDIDEENGKSEVVVTNRCGGAPPFEAEHPCSSDGS